MQVVARARPPHVERGRRARRAHHAEVEQELLGEIQIRRLQPRKGDVADFDDRHRDALLAAYYAVIISL